VIYFIAVSKSGIVSASYVRRQKNQSWT